MTHYSPCSKKVYAIYVSLLACFFNSYMLGSTIPEPATIDLGVIKPAITQTAKVAIKNSSPVSLKVTAVDLECNECTKIEFKPATIKPNESAEFTVHFTPFPDDDGFIQKKIIFTTSDPLQRKVVVPIRCNVNQYGGAWPAIIQPLAQQAPGTDVTVTFDIVNISDAPIKPLYASGPIHSPKLTLSKDPIAPGSRASVTGKWHLPSNPGNTTGQIVIYVDHPSLTKLTVPFQAVVSSAPITPLPAAVPSPLSTSLAAQGNTSATQTAAVPLKDAVTVPPTSALPSPALKTEPTVKDSSGKPGIENKPAAVQTIDLNLRDSLVDEFHKSVQSCQLTSSLSLNN